VTELRLSCLRTFKTVAREGVWGQGTVHIFSYASTVGYKCKSLLSLLSPTGSPFDE